MERKRGETLNDSDDYVLAPARCLTVTVILTLLQHQTYIILFAPAFDASRVSGFNTCCRPSS